ncbi:MAG TPA: ABC transporter substrate-binding protein [Candidatus Binatia bacterium]|jgi:ABC-type nitrate/sulfonate/bicarbonate transport system substrate-binding protein|nr:ABC transporter substrate-binding protein [Candidatus Binatia bacterium]
MQHQMEFFRPILLFLIMLVAAQADAAEHAKLNLGYSTTGPTAVGLWVAKDIGAFDKYGVDPNLIFISSSPVMVPALIGGDVQAAIAGANAVIAAVLRGAAIVSVASLANRPYLRLWVHPEVNHVEELRGKTFGVSRFGATTDNLTRILLRRVGLENAVTIRQLGGTLEVGLAFRHRQIDGAVLATLRTDAPHRILIELADTGIQYSMGQLVVSRDFQRRSPDTLEKIMRAYIEGVAVLRDPTQRDRVLKTVARYTRLKESKPIEEIYNDAARYVDRIPRVEADAVSATLELMGKKGLPIETFADNSIIDRLVKEGFTDQVYKKR